MSYVKLPCNIITADVIDDRLIAVGDDGVYEIVQRPDGEFDYNCIACHVKWFDELRESDVPETDG